MRTLFKLTLLLTATCTIFGCAHNYYNIPQDTLEQKVKTIGVAPFFTDGESDIRHPERGAIATVIQGYNAKNEKELIARLRGTGIFYAVRQVEGDPGRLFSTLLSNKERRDDAGIIYNKYFFKKDALKRLLDENGLDAILFVTVNGLTRPGKVYASNFLSYLETDYNYLSMTAQMLDRDGNTIWEYPNFRQKDLSYSMLFPLQYPDFDEAAANLSDKVEVKFKTVAGVKAAFAKSESSAVSNGPKVSTLYVKQFDEILSLLKTYQPLFGEKKKPEPAPVAAPEPVAAFAPAAPAPYASPAPVAAPGPVAAPRPVAATRPIEAPEFTSSDIVPEERPAR